MWRWRGAGPREKETRDIKELWNRLMRTEGYARDPCEKRGRMKEKLWMVDLMVT